MEREKLTELLHILPANAAGRGPACPDNNMLAAVVDGQLPDAEHEHLALHLADCDFCLSQVGLMKRLQQSAASPAPNDLVLARAKRLGKHTRRTAFGKTARWASAAAVVLAVLLIARLDPAGSGQTDATMPSPADITSRAPGLQQARNIDPVKIELRVLTPANGASIDPGKLEFTWTSIPGSLYYDVRIVTDGGDLVWQAKVEGTKLALPASLQLEPQTDYFFRVDAHLASAKDISSSHVLFSTRE